MKVLPRVLLGLVITTIVILLLYWQFGSAKRVIISPQDYAFFTTNDQKAGGASESALQFDDNVAQIDCELKSSSYAWPYCGISIHINPDAQLGIDLSDIHTIRLNVDFQGPNSVFPTMRMYLRNFNPVYSTLENEYTHKYNGLEFVPGVGKGQIEIPMHSLQVMTWWLVDNHISMEHSAPEYSNINKIEFATGSASPLGKYQLTLHQIELIGNYVAGEKLFLAVLLIWVAAGAWLATIEINRHRREVHIARQRQENLQRLNYALQDQNAKFVEMAHRDELTGSINRHGIRDWLQEQAHLVSKKPNQFCILFIDIDHFKKINDVYGHLQGDDLLREFALVISREIRETDKLVRWGGEEFVVFCSQTKLEQASELAERLRDKVENQFWIHGGALTCSIGLAEMQDERVTETLSRADEALYQAKRLGRNRVEIHTGAQE